MQKLTYIELTTSMCRDCHSCVRQKYISLFCEILVIKICTDAHCNDKKSFRHAHNHNLHHYSLGHRNV